MNGKKLFFWACIFFALLVYVTVFELKQPKEEESLEEKFDRVFQVAPDAVTRVQLIRNGKKVTITRQGNRWELDPASEVPVRQEAVQSLITSITGLVKVEVIEDNPADIGQYGLENPDTELTVFVEKKKRPITLLLGNDSPTGVSMYAMVQGSNQVIQVGTVLRFSINTIFERLF